MFVVNGSLALLVVVEVASDCVVGLLCWSFAFRWCFVLCVMVAIAVFEGMALGLLVLVCSLWLWSVPLVGCCLLCLV